MIVESSVIFGMFLLLGGEKEVEGRGRNEEGRGEEPPLGKRSR